VRALWLKSVEGVENLPARGPVIIASNHESYLDFIVLDAALPRQPVFLAGEVFYRNPLLAWAFKRMHFIRVDRRHPRSGIATIRETAKSLRRGNLVVMYPEGSRSPDGLLRKAHEGIGLLAHLAEVQVVPVAITGTHEAWGKGVKRPKPYPCKVRFGEPMHFSRAAQAEDREVVAQTTREIMGRIAELAGEVYLW
jgi:1-acyl-sn-glycerol-3-phosphate acyltransferase